MAVEWVDLSGLVAVAGEARSADFNSVLQNLEYLYTTPQVAVRLTAPQSIPDATDTTIQWQSQAWDTNGMWGIAAPSKIVIPRDGVYSIICSVLWAEADDGTKRSAFLDVNGARRTGIQVPSVDPTEFQLVCETNLVTGDELEVDVRQLSGAALDLLGRPGGTGDARTRMTVRWVGAPPVTP